MADDRLRYSDIIEPDDSIERLISQLGDLNKSYETMVNAIRAGAERIVNAMKSASGATSQGRKEIDEAAIAASRLERAEKELAFAMSETGKQVAWLKAQTSDQNKMTVEQRRYIEQIATSYDRLKSDLKENVALFRSMTEAEREDAKMGGQVIETIIDLKNQIAAIDAQLKPHIEQLSAVQKAEQRLNFLLSEEGQRYLDLQAKIREVTNARREQKAAIDPLDKAYSKLAYAESSANQQLQSLNIQTQEANRVAKLRAQLALSEEGSYNALSAQYSLNVIELNKMGAAWRANTAEGKALEETTRAIRARMTELQEATGNYTLSVGHYEKAWNGLTFSVQQVVRELPAAAVSMNTFFLAISNNIPMVVDEIRKIREQNKLFAAEGKEQISVIRAIGRSLFSWQSALVVVLSIFSMFGEEISDWVGKVLTGRKAAMSMVDALDNLNKELESNAGGYGDNIVKLRQLSTEYKKLKSNAEKTEWITKNASEFNKLNVVINDINTADKVFIDRTAEVVAALQLRAKATAAQRLASEKFEEALVARNKAETEELRKEESLRKLRETEAKYGTATTAQYATPGAMAGAQVSNVDLMEDAFDRTIKGLRKQQKEAEKTAESYFSMGEEFEEAYAKILKALGLEEGTNGSGGRGRTPRDAEDTLESLSLAANKAYQKSLTELEQEEIKKRRQELISSYNTEVAELAVKYNKIQRILDGQHEKYKKLTDSQREQAIKAQEDIVKAMENMSKATQRDLGLLTYQKQEQDAQKLLDTLNLQMQAVKQGSEEELRLRLQILQAEEQIALARNKQLPPSQQQSEAAIKSGFRKQTVTTVVEYDNTAFEQQQALDEAIFNEVERSDNEITRFKLEQERDRWTRQIALAKLGALDWSKAQIQAAEATVRGIDRQIDDLSSFLGKVGEQGLGYSILDSLGFNDKQINALQQATDIIIDNISEIMEAEVEAAEQAVELAQERVDAAKEAYDAEVEARNNGYANNVATAKKELEQEKKNQIQKQKILEQAQRRQQALDSISQTSSLITASALLWKSFAGTGPAAPFLAAAAIAAMWTSFAVAKVKARQVATQSTEEYGEGGLEFLEGGSHASGHDIDLGVNNKRKKRMKAEGGEALAIINKRNTKKYKALLPEVIKSFNKGNFEEKYLNAFTSSDNLSIVQNNTSQVDLSNIEKDVQSIRKQNEYKYYSLPNGTIVILHKNVKRIIKN